MISEHQSKRYCSEDISLIENYNQAIADTTQMWVCHHRRGLDESIRRNEMKECGLYKKRPASELIFIPFIEHQRMHSSGKNNPFYGKRHTEATKEKNRQANLGNKYALGCQRSEEEKAVLSAAAKLRTGEKSPVYNTRWFNNGEKNVRAKECPEGFVPGMMRRAS